MSIKKRLKSLGLSKKAFSVKADYHEKTVINWGEYWPAWALWILDLLQEIKDLRETVEHLNATIHSLTTKKKSPRKKRGQVKK